METENKFNILAQEIEELKKELATVKNNNKTINNTQIINISVKKYIQQNYPSAPHLLPLKDYLSLDDEPEGLSDDDTTETDTSISDDEITDIYSDKNLQQITNDASNKVSENNIKDKYKINLIKILLHYYDKKDLHAYLGDFLIGHYKKNNPKNQSLWNSDTVRLTYIFKQWIDSKKKSNWTVDKGGIEVKKIIIYPLLKYIKKVLMTYIDLLAEQSNIEPSDNLNKKMKNLLELLTYVDAKHSNVANDMIRYMARHFYLPIN